MRQPLIREARLPDAAKRTCALLLTGVGIVLATASPVNARSKELDFVMGVQHVPTGTWQMTSPATGGTVTLDQSGNGNYHFVNGPSRDAGSIEGCVQHGAEYGCEWEWTYTDTEKSITRHGTLTETRNGNTLEILTHVAAIDHELWKVPAYSAAAQSGQTLTFARAGGEPAETDARGPVAIYLESNFGPVTIKIAQDDSVTGFWKQNEGTGQIAHGRWDPKKQKLTFQYYQPWNEATGEAEFLLSHDDRKFVGAWEEKKGDGTDDHGKWTMSLQ